MNHALEKEYCIAVAHKSFDKVDIAAESNEEKIYHKHSRRLLLPDQDYFDFFQFVSNTTSVRVKLISTDYFKTEGKISDDVAQKRCLFLQLSTPERFLEQACSEITSDRNNALKWCQMCLTHLIIKVAKNKGITHGHSPSKCVVSISNIGLALTQCECPADFEAIWDCMYGVFDSLTNWQLRLEEACLAHFGWKFDDNNVNNTFHSNSRVNCIHKLASLAINNIWRVVNGFATRKKLPTISIKRPNSAITAENRWKKRVKTEFNVCYVKPDNAVSNMNHYLEYDVYAELCFISSVLLIICCHNN
jgi:hypothetical protein